jgi:hypothetical protein
VARTMEVERIRQVLSTFFQGLDTHDSTTIEEVWHPNAKLFLNNAILNTRTMSFLQRLPEFMNFRIEEIKHIEVDGGIATARVDYLMSIGIHSGFFNLVKADDKWFIANWVDHGMAGVRREA